MLAKERSGIIAEYCISSGHDPWNMVNVRSECGHVSYLHCIYVRINRAGCRFDCTIGSDTISWAQLSKYVNVHIWGALYVNVHMGCICNVSL